MSNKIGTSIAMVALVVALLAAYGAVDIKWPWESLPEVASTTTTVTYDAPPKIVEIESISLDCRSRVHAQVPVEGTKEHTIIGQTYRTDTVEMLAIGDVDTCVNNRLIEITNVDGKSVVTIPAEAIEFVRPRVDALATQDSVQFTKGTLGKITDAFPWVSDNNGLTPAAYSYAQVVIGGSDCMAQAYDVTSQMLVDAYRDQAIERGLAATDITVNIVGAPDLKQNETVENLDDFNFASTGDQAVCEVAPDATGGVEQPAEAIPAPHSDPRL